MPAKSHSIRLNLRLYKKVPSDDVIIKGLEDFSWHGAKHIEIKRILFEYFNAGGKPETSAISKNKLVDAKLGEKKVPLDPPHTPIKSSLSAAVIEDEQPPPPEIEAERKEQQFKRLFTIY